MILRWNATGVSMGAIPTAVGLLHVEPLPPVILDDPFDPAEVVHDLPDHVVKCHTCPAELPELN